MENEELIAAPVIAEVATTPVVSEPVIDVVVEAPAVVAEAPIAAPIEASEPPPEPEAPTHPTSLLSEFDAKPAEETKVQESAPESTPEEAQKEAVVLEEPKPLEEMVYEAFKVPDGVDVDKEKVDKFTKAIGEHRLPQEVAQQLFDMHVAEVKSIADKLSTQQWSVYNETRKEWRNQVMSDPEIGGSGHQTAMKIIAEARDHLVPESERAAFNEMLNITGVGDNLAFLKPLYRAGKILQAPKTLEVPIQPPPDRGTKPQTKYSSLYTHPTSKI